MEHPILAIASDPHGTADRVASLPHVPGVSIAGVVGGRVELGAAGVADAESGEPVTTATRFRPGSITKLLTAALVFGCMHDGLVSLDDPVDGFEGVLVRHLVSHTSGIDAGDVFVDTGTGDDALHRYIDLIRGAPRLFPPGTAFSYNNAGFVLAGDLVARLRGMPYEEVLLGTLPMHDAAFVPGAVDDSRTARGHAGTTPLPRVTDNPVCCRALGPAGGTLTATAADIGAFLVAHLADPGAAIMHELQVDAPGGVAQMLGPAFGWMVWRNAQFASVRIGGAYPSHSGIVAADIDADAAIVVLTNSDQGVHVVQAMLDAAGPLPAASEPAPGDLGVYAGTYRSHIGDLVVSTTENRLHLSYGQGLETDAVPRDRITFVSPAGPVAFFDFAADGRPNLARGLMRVSRRVPEGET